MTRQLSTFIVSLGVSQIRETMKLTISDTGKRQIEGTLPGTHAVDILHWMNDLPPWLKPWERKARSYFRNDVQWSKTRMEVSV